MDFPEEASLRILPGPPWGRTLHSKGTDIPKKDLYI